MAEAKQPAKTTKPAQKATPYGARLKQQFNETIKHDLKKELELKSVEEAPRIRKIIVSSGLGKARDDKKIIEVANNTISKITGQQPNVRSARKSIATFKLREGDKIGTMVTLRGDRMYEFLDRVVNIVLPRLRDFHGVSNRSFDAQGNYSIGFHDQSVFPELTFEETTTPHGLQINIVIEAKDPKHAKALLEKFGMPFMKEGK